MAITDPTAISFSNKKIRTSADTLAQSYYSAKTILDVWDSQDIGALIPNVAGDIVEDGAELDGRNVVDGEMENGVIDLLRVVTGAFEANDNARLTTVLKVAVNPTRS